MFCVLESLYQPLQGHKSKLPELKTGTCLSGPSTSATAWKKFSSLFPSTVLATAKLWSGNLEEILIALNQQLCYDSNKCFMLTKAYQWPFLLAISLTWLELCWPSLFRLVYFPKQKRPKHHPMHHRIVFFPFKLFKPPENQKPRPYTRDHGNDMSDEGPQFSWGALMKLVSPATS